MLFRGDVWSLALRAQPLGCLSRLLKTRLKDWLSPFFAALVPHGLPVSYGRGWTA